MKKIFKTRCRAVLGLAAVLFAGLLVHAQTCSTASDMEPATQSFFAQRRPGRFRFDLARRLGRAPAECHPQSGQQFFRHSNRSERQPERSGGSKGGRPLAIPAASARGRAPGSRRISVRSFWPQRPNRQQRRFPDSQPAAGHIRLRYTGCQHQRRSLHCCLCSGTARRRLEVRRTLY